MTETEKIQQLTKVGDGVATAIVCPLTKKPFLLVAATEDDLEALLIMRCQFEPEQFTASKFRNVKVMLAGGETAKSKRGKTA